MDGRSGSESGEEAVYQPPLPSYDSGTFFQQLVENTSEGLLTIDEDSTIVFANPAIEEILGHRPADLVGSSKMTLIPERLRDAHAAGLDQYIRTGEKNIDWDGVELPALHADGHEVPVVISLREHAHGNDRLFTGIVRDVSERKLRQHRFEAVFNNTYQFTGLLEPDGTLIEANETLCSFAGLERSDVVGRPLWETYWFQSNEGSREAARTAVETAGNGEVYRTEVRIQGEDRTSIIDFSVRPITDDDGSIRLLVPEGRNVTAIKRRERHLRVLHRLLRHNLRNDLNVIAGYGERLRTELEDETLVDAVNQISATATELIETSETAKSLADATLRERWDGTATSVEVPLERAVENVRREPSSCSIELCGPVEGSVNAGENLHRVYEELIENAIVHSTAPEPTVELTVTAENGTTTVHIDDQNTPIPVAERDGVFNDEPQTQLNHGDGLGLWVATLILDSYGGELEYTRRADGNRLSAIVPGGDAELSR